MSSAEAPAALSEALDDEYRARATYRKVIERFGPVRPFVNIVEAENRGIRAGRLFSLFFSLITSGGGPASRFATP